MPLPAISRAFWSETIHCKTCGKPRPWFLAATKTTCIPCKREKERLRVKKYRENRSREKIALQKQRDLARKAFVPPALRRCRDMYYKINPKNIPKWVTIESLMPIYEYAEQLDDKNPGFRHVVGHIHPISKDKSVCGLHTIDNLRIIRCKRMNGRVFYPTDLTSQKNK